MGARSNIVIQDGDDRAWLYGHWMSCQAVEHAANGLRGDRFDDPSYLAAHIFTSMLDSQGAEGRGYGISARRTDNQFPILVIDSHPRWSTGEDRGRADVWFENEDGLRRTRVFTREEFLAICDTIPPFRPAWTRLGETGHPCAYEFFIERELPTSAQTRDT